MRPRALFLFCVTLVEFVNTSSGINELHLPGKERVGRTGDLQLVQRIFGSVLPSGCVLGFYAGTGKEGMAIGHILEYHESIAIWMYFFFHFFLNGPQN